MVVKNETGLSKVIVLKIGQADIDAMLVNFDLDDSGNYSYMEDEMIDIIMNYLPEYSMGYDCASVAPSDIVPMLREAAKSVIRIKQVNEIKQYLDLKTPYDQWDPSILKAYNSKGIFSELILHFILRDMKNTIPLISKIYFKDSNAVEAHGFDAVHITDNDKKLWLGETKFYNDGKQGLKALIDDLTKHFCKDYLNEQFVIINRALIRNNEIREKWIKELNNANRLEEKLNMIIIPLLCIYENPVATEIINELNTQKSCDTVYFEHVLELKHYFDKNNCYKNKDKVSSLLILLPVESKDRIVLKMLSKIYSMQNI